MSIPMRRLSLVATVMVTVLAVLAGPAVVSASAFAPGDYDNTVNTTVNNQTTRPVSGRYLVGEGRPCTSRTTSMRTST